MRIAFVTALVGITAALAADLPLPEGDAKKTVQAACSTCHTLGVLEGKHWSRLRWQAVVDNMIQRATKIPNEPNSKVTPKEPVSGVLPNEPISAANSNKIIDYLAKNFGEDRSQRLVEDICSLCHEWQRVERNPKTRDQWTSTIKGMIVEGAPVTDEEFALIVDYLAKNYGPAQ